MTMDIYAQVAPASTRAALAKLGQAFVPAPTKDPALLHNTAAHVEQRALPDLEIGL